MMNELKKLSKIIKETEAYFVLTTTHRNSEMMVNRFLLECQQVSIGNRIIGKTIELPITKDVSRNRQIRPKEIKLWLKNHQVKKWIVLDDMDLNIENFIRTDFKIGLTNDDVIKAIKYLH